MEIKCKKGNCEHNENCACCADRVEINLETACNSYCANNAKKDIQIKDGNFFEIAANMTKAKSKNVPLECRKTDCLYNRAEKCHANGITVITGDDNKKEEADCATYIHS